MDHSLPNREYLLNDIVAGAPFPIGVYIGSELKIEVANPAIIASWGKGNDVIGKLYTEILPELENQHIFEQLRSVLKTGIPFQAKNQIVKINRDGELKPYYFNYNFMPLYDSDG